MKRPRYVGGDLYRKRHNRRSRGPGVTQGALRAWLERQLEQMVRRGELVRAPDPTGNGRRLYALPPDEGP